MRRYATLDEEADADRQSMDADSGVGAEAETSKTSLTASPDAENGEGDAVDAENVEAVDAGTSADYIDASLSLGTGENGSSEESLAQKDSAPVPKVEEKLEAHSEWWHTAMLLLADIVGSGVLGLPGAFARVGWFFGIVLLIVCYPM